MSDIVKVALIGGCFSALPTLLGFINNFHLKRLAVTTEKLADHTNGMQATIERLAELKGAQGERDKHDGSKP